MEKVKIFNHPIIQHHLAIIRDEATSTEMFAQSVTKIASLMTYEITQDLKTAPVEIVTPLCKTTAYMLAKEVVIVPILRAGLGMVEGIRDFIPHAKVGHIGLYRDEETLQPQEYFCKLPQGIEGDTVFVTDPMLATGGSAVKAIDMLKERHVQDIRLICLVGAPEGIKAVQQAHPDIPIYLAALDEKLNDAGYIVPGLGDAGDRIFGTE